MSKELPVLEAENQHLHARVEHLTMQLKEGLEANKRGLDKIGELAGKLGGERNKSKILAVEVELLAQELGKMRDKFEKLGHPWPTPSAHKRTAKDSPELKEKFDDYAKRALTAQRDRIDKKLAELSNGQQGEIEEKFIDENGEKVGWGYP